MRLTIEVEFETGQTVYNMTNNMRGIVIGYMVDDKSVLYRIEFADGCIHTMYASCLSYDKSPQLM